VAGSERAVQLQPRLRPKACHCDHVARPADIALLPHISCHCGILKLQSYKLKSELAIILAPAWMVGWAVSGYGLETLLFHLSTRSPRCAIKDALHERFA
jgi:hypothetical protein